MIRKHATGSGRECTSHCTSTMHITHQHINIVAREHSRTHCPWTTTQAMYSLAVPPQLQLHRQHQCHCLPQAGKGEQTFTHSPIPFLIHSFTHSLTHPLTCLLVSTFSLTHSHSHTYSETPAALLQLPSACRHHHTKQELKLTYAQAGSRFINNLTSDIKRSQRRVLPVVAHTIACTTVTV